MAEEQDQIPFDSNGNANGTGTGTATTDRKVTYHLKKGNKDHQLPHTFFKRYFR